MEEYTMPARRPDVPGLSPDEVWAATIAALPVGASVAGEVIGRQPFGVFIRLDGLPGAVGLAEIIAMPEGMGLPVLGARIRGEVIDHVEHNRQVRVRLHEAGTALG
jgi:ribosomal protein S1